MRLGSLVVVGVGVMLALFFAGRGEEVRGLHTSASQCDGSSCDIVVRRRVPQGRTRARSRSTQVCVSVRAHIYSLGALTHHPGKVAALLRAMLDACAGKAPAGGAGDSACTGGSAEGRKEAAGESTGRHGAMRQTVKETG